MSSSVIELKCIGGKMLFTPFAFIALVPKRRLVRIGKTIFDIKPGIRSEMKTTARIWAIRRDQFKLIRRFCHRLKLMKKGCQVLRS